MQKMRIREMIRSDVGFAYGCVSAEGWAGETPEVFETFLSHDPRGCWVAESEGRPVGICVATRYRATGFIGELIVIKEERGKGVGGSLFRCALDYLRACGVASICLDGDLDAVPIYERAGFRKVCRSLRFVGTSRGRRAPGVRQARGEDLPRIRAMDSDLFGDDRGFFIDRRLAAHPEYCFVRETGGGIVGFIMARPGVGVLSVGPWAARGGDADAVLLLEAVAAAAGGVPLRLGILERNKRAVGLVRAIGSFEETTPSWRMAFGPSDALGIHDDLLAVGSAATG